MGVDKVEERVERLLGGALTEPGGERLQRVLVAHFVLVRNLSGAEEHGKGGDEWWYPGDQVPEFRRAKELRPSEQTVDGRSLLVGNPGLLGARAVEPFLESVPTD